jgi:hypothetical protein
MHTPPVSGTAVRPDSGRKPRTALTTTGADDGSAGSGSHAQPKAVCSRPTAIVRLEGALHVRAPSSTGVGGGSPTTAQARGYARARSGALVGPIHGTWRDGTGSNRTGGAQAQRTPRRQVSDRFLPRHADNVQQSCGHRLNPPRGLVTVPGSTSVVETPRSLGTKPCFRRSAEVCWVEEAARQTLHTLWMTVWT